MFDYTPHNKAHKTKHDTDIDYNSWEWNMSIYIFAYQ